MAKPLTRLVRRLCNAIGYDLLRLQKTKLYEDVESGHGRGGGFDAFEASVPREVRSFKIYLRSCARIQVYLQDRGRFNGVPKSEVLLRCLNSLVASINFAVAAGVEVPISLVVLDDNSDVDVVAGIAQILETADCETRLEHLTDTGMRHSLTRTFETARDEGGDVVYLVEDDYLHDERAVLESIESYGRIAASVGADVILFPADYPENYRHVRPAHIILGSHRHWRRIEGTTGTQICSGAILRKYWDNYMALTAYGTDPEISENNTINLILNEVMGFSPLPALSVHFQHFDTLSPYFDWEHWWARSAVEDAGED